MVHGPIGFLSGSNDPILGLDVNKPFWTLWNHLSTCMAPLGVLMSLGAT